MARLSTRHTTGRRLLLAAVLAVPALTLGGLVHAAGDDGPVQPRATSVQTGPVEPTTSTTPPATSSAGAPAPGSSAPAGEPSTSVPAPTADPPAAAPGPAVPSESASAAEPAPPSEASAPAPEAGTQPAPTAAVDADAAAQAAAAEALAAVAAAGGQARGTIEFVVLGPDGREQLASPGAGVPTWTASLSKTLVAQQLLDPDGARPPVTPADLRLLERALTASDDSAMNALWSRFDGPTLVADAATEFGLPGTAAPADRSQWGEATTTARDYAGFLHRLRFSLDDTALATLTGWLQSTSDRAGDGFDQTFGLRSRAAGTGAPAAVKQGWMCCIDGRRQLHSAGSLADGRTVVLLGDFPASTSWVAAHTALDTAAQMLVARP